VAGEKQKERILLTRCSYCTRMSVCCFSNISIGARLPERNRSNTVEYHFLLFL
ncbi:hypothetical protein CP8484711_0288B, partial [Chlamydia psittaci 84-8471/1]